MAGINIEEMLVSGAIVTDDPVERHVARCLQRLRHQNKRLQGHIEKTGAWAHLKTVDLWKPFDFYHYFTTKFREKYQREYKNVGNLVRAYARIDEFRMQNQIKKQTYKEFIDTAFERYFNNINVPSVAHICSKRLFNHLMGQNGTFVSAQQYHALDAQLAKENEEFEEYLKQKHY